VRLLVFLALGALLQLPSASAERAMVCEDVPPASACARIDEIVERVIDIASTEPPGAPDPSSLPLPDLPDGPGLVQDVVDDLADDAPSPEAGPCDAVPSRSPVTIGHAIGDRLRGSGFPGAGDRVDNVADLASRPRALCQQLL